MAGSRLLEDRRYSLDVGFRAFRARGCAVNVRIAGELGTAREQRGMVGLRQPGFRECAGTDLRSTGARAGREASKVDPDVDTVDRPVGLASGIHECGVSYDRKWVMRFEKAAYRGG